MTVVGRSSCSFALSALFVLAGCSSSTTSSPGTTPDAPAACAADTACAAPTPLCDVPTKACVALPPGNEIGYRDGSSASVTFTEIYSTGAAAKPSDLAFNPQRPGELWVIGYADDSTHVGTGLDGDAPKWKRSVDPAAKHFMDEGLLGSGRVRRFGYDNGRGHFVIAIHDTSGAAQQIRERIEVCDSLRC